MSVEVDNDNSNYDDEADDPKNWWGVHYFNPRDNRFFIINTRAFSVNWGNPSAIAFYFLLLLVICYLKMKQMHY